MDFKQYGKLSFLFFLQFLLWGSWYVTLGTYAINTLHFSGQQIGILYTCGALAATLSPLLSGILADRLIAVERLLALLHLTGAVVLWSLTHMTSFLPFFLTLLVYSILYMPTHALTASLVLQQLTDTALLFPRIRVWGTIGWILAGLTISTLAWERTVWPLYTASVISLALGLYCLTLPHTPPKAAGTGEERSFWQRVFDPAFTSMFRDKFFIVFISCLILERIPSAFYYSFVNPFMEEIGIEHTAAKMSYGQISEILIMLVLPALLYRWGIRYVLFIGLLFWGLRYGFLWAGLEWGQHGWIYLGLIVHGICFNFSNLSAQIYMDKRVPGHLRSTGQGFMTFATLGIGVTIGSPLAGWLVQSNTLPDGNHNWQAIWSYPFLFGIVVALVFVIFFRVGPYGIRPQSKAADTGQ
ncbi:MAG: MFS transporter [Saprospiraceae bacterium]|nr:MFS transporter [Saprospiraceae bacterium]